MQPSEEPTHQKPRRAGLAVAALVLAFAGPIAHAMLLDQPFLRGSGLPAWVLMGLGVALAVVSLRDRRWIARGPAFAAFALTAVYAWGFFFWAVLPNSEATLSPDEMAADFTLLDHTGAPVSLRQAHANGPVLLVFYRGRW